MGHWTGTPFCHGSPPHGCFASAGAGGHSSKGKQNSTNHPATAGEDGLFVGNGWERLLTLALPQTAVGDGSDRLPGPRLPAPGSSEGTGLGHCPIHAASHWCPPGWHSCGGCAFDLARNPQSDEVSRMWPERVGNPRGSPHLQTTGPPRCCWRRPHGPWRVGASHPDWHPKLPNTNPSPCPESGSTHLGASLGPGVGHSCPQQRWQSMARTSYAASSCSLLTRPWGEASPKSCGCLHFGPPAPLARRGAAPLVAVPPAAFDQNLHPPLRGTTERVGHCACQGGVWPQGLYGFAVTRPLPTHGCHHRCPEGSPPDKPPTSRPKPRRLTNPAWDCPIELFARCLRKFPAETAPGPSGLRVQHLRDACPVGGNDALLAQLCAVVNLLAQGRAPDFVAPVLAGAGLVALPKPNGGVRPIAVGEILRRLTSKCLMTMVRDDLPGTSWGGCSWRKWKSHPHR